MVQINRNIMISLIRIFRFALFVCLLWTTSSCSSSAPSVIPSKTPTITAQTPEIEITRWLSFTSGILSIKDGCLIITGSDAGNKFTVVWPPDFAVAVDGNTIKVTSGMVTGQKKEYELKIGGNVKLGGGTVNQLESDLQKGIPMNCASPYWIVGNILQ